MLTLDEHFIEMIIGAVTILGGLVLLLNKFGLIHFGKRRKLVEKKAITCPMNKCPSHDEFVKKLNGLHEAHILSHNLHQQHEKKFANGKNEFDAIKKTLRVIGENIAVLKDRSDREERIRVKNVPLG
jgi:hypothetical protein